MMASAAFLVTGGCGFIGSHLVAALLEAGHAVRVLDDLSSGRIENLAPGAELVRGDVGDATLLSDAMRGMSGCFHLAAIASVERGVEAWTETHRVNLSATIAVFDAARRAGRLSVVYASSAAVYGANDALPLAETAATRPLSAYGADKLGCEQHARVAGVVHQLPTFGLRFFNVYGPRQDPGSPYSGVISIFADRLLRGEPVTIYGDGRQTRDFVHVGDVVAALRAAIKRADTGAPVANVCSSQPTSVIELARLIAAASGCEAEIRQGDARAGEIRHSLGSATMSRNLLGLLPRMSLAAGLDEVVRWMRAGRPGLSRGNA
jgi:UDP-glucose 4-epimerase